MTKKNKSSLLNQQKRMSGLQLLVFALVFAIVGGLVSWVAFAAPGNGRGGKPGGGGGTISLAMVNDKNADGQPNFGDKVTFQVSTSATSYPYVTLKCYVSGSLVYSASKGIFTASLGQDFTLGPTPNWQAGGADCTATLQNWDSYSKNGKITNLTSINFTVSP